MANAQSYTSVEQYITAQPEEKQRVISQLRQAVMDNLPGGFEECINYNMIGYVVPHSLYPAGYHCNPSLPLPFINLAAQKHHYGFYHMGIYAMPELESWFRGRFAEVMPTKLDMGKSCIRFKNSKHIPFELIGELTRKVSVDHWIATYRSSIKPNAN